MAHNLPRTAQSIFLSMTDMLDELLYADDMDKNVSSGAKCKEPWIKAHGHVITLISQSVQKYRGCTPNST